MDIKTYLKKFSVHDRREFAQRCGTSYGHLQNIASGRRSCAAVLALNIERESGTAVSMESLGRADLKAALNASGYVKPARRTRNARQRHSQVPVN
jgi:DNA-binding transcriptional regulator YdaS (Cro superfamily)